jgi:hypothetical protein
MVAAAPCRELVRARCPRGRCPVRAPGLVRWAPAYLQEQARHQSQEEAAEEAGGVAILALERH